MEDDAEDSIPVVTISLPSRRISTSPRTLLVQNSSSPLPPLTLTQVEHENDDDDPEISKSFSSFSNALNNNRRDESLISTSGNHLNNLHSTLRYSQSEINLVELMELPSASPYINDSTERNNSPTLPNSSIGRKDQFDVSNAAAPLSASLNNNNNNNNCSSDGKGEREDVEKEEKTNKKQSLWTRIKSSICCCCSRWMSRETSSTTTTMSSSSTYHHKVARRPRLSRLLYYLRVFLTHLFSTTGLCFLVVAYSGLGAVIFTHLESGHEFAVKASLEGERRRTAAELWNYTVTLNVLHEKFWLDEVVRRIGEFEEKVVKTMLTEGYGATQEQWSFSGALLYSVTVITTIGEEDKH